MTEQEAKTKWCPFVRGVPGKISEDGQSDHRSDATAFNRVIDGNAGRWAFPKFGGACIGSACMAWRDKPQWRVRSDHPWQDGENPKNGPNNEGRRVGWCGLAGKP